MEIPEPLGGESYTNELKRDLIYHGFEKGYLSIKDPNLVRDLDPNDYFEWLSEVEYRFNIRSKGES